MPFERWNSKLATATDEAARQGLLSEIGLWRARNLTDIPGQRDAAFALSTLHSQLGNGDAAVREARTLLSLCQTSPVASGSEMKQAKSLLSGTGVSVPKIVTTTPARRNDRRDRIERGGRSERPPRDTNAAQNAAIEKALAGEFPAARKILKGKKGREAVRVWIDLCEAMAAEPDAQARLLRRLEARLRQTIGVAPAGKRSAPDVPAAPPTAEDGALGQLIGRRLPRRREPFLRALNAWLAEHPDQVDALASTALQHHIDTVGATSPAPWLASFVARALVAGGEATQAVVKAHEEEAAARLFREPAFERCLSLVGSPRFSGLRRSVLGRNAEPDDRRAWTLRFDDGQKMLVVVPSHPEPYPAAIAAQLTERLPHLCSQFVVLAPGAGNGPLREVLAGAGLVSLDGEPSDTELLAALDGVTPIAKPARARPERRSEQAAPVTDEPSEPTIDPMIAVQAVLAPDATPSLDEVKAAFGPLRKLRDAFLYASRTWRPFPENASARTAILLRAADEEAPESLRVPEATTLSLRIAAAQGGDVLKALSEGPTAARFGGPGVLDVIGVVKGASSTGWDLRRAFRGTTRRERRNQPMLNELGDSLDGLWRLGVEKGDQRAEIWFVAALPIEGRAAIPQLLLEERSRIVVLPIDPELMSWFGGLDAPPAIGWMGDEGAEIGAALDALQA